MATIVTKQPGWNRWDNISKAISTALTAYLAQKQRTSEIQRETDIRMLHEGYVPEDSTIGKTIDETINNQQGISETVDQATQTLTPTSNINTETSKIKTKPKIKKDKDKVEIDIPQSQDVVINGRKYKKLPKAPKIEVTNMGGSVGIFANGNLIAKYTKTPTYDELVKMDKSSKVTLTHYKWDPKTNKYIGTKQKVSPKYAANAMKLNSKLNNDKEFYLIGEPVTPISKVESKKGMRIISWRDKNGKLHKESVEADTEIYNNRVNEIIKSGGSFDTPPAVTSDDAALSSIHNVTTLNQLVDKNGNPVLESKVTAEYFELRKNNTPAEALKQIYDKYKSNTILTKTTEKNKVKPKKSKQGKQFTDEELEPYKRW